jgi:hypothetical protein
MKDEKKFLERFNKDTENAWKNYHKIKSEEHEKEKQKKIDDWRKAIETAWFPKPVELEIKEVKISRWEGIFESIHRTDWKYLYSQGGLKRIFGHIGFLFKLHKNQNVLYKQKIMIRGFDTNDKPREVKLVMTKYNYDKGA